MKLQIDKLNNLIAQATACIAKLNEVGDKYAKISIKEDALYNNKELCQILCVDDRLIKKYRDNGLLSFHRVGDKYWYLGADIMQFLNRNRFEMFA